MTTRCKDIRGKRFGKLTAIRIHKRINGRIYWICSCECGRRKSIDGHRLRLGRISNCGCSFRSKIINLVGRKFGRLTVESRAPDVTKGGTRIIRWLCLCSCGQRIEVRGRSLRSGNTRSCGCLLKDMMKYRHTKHGLSQTKLYLVWRGMLSRCYNKNSISYKNYGGRGIGVFKQWRSGTDFLEWAMTHGYRQGLRLERVDNNKSYSPKNCVWTTQREQALNTRRNVYITYRGKRATLSQWAEITGINASRLALRLRRGWTGAKLFDPRKFNGCKRKFVRVASKTISVSNWAESIGVNYRTVLARLRNGWTLRDIACLPAKKHSWRRGSRKRGVYADAA